MKKVFLISSFICAIFFLSSCNQGTEESSAGTSAGVATNFT